MHIGQRINHARATFSTIIKRGSVQYKDMHTSRCGLTPQCSADILAYPDVCLMLGKQ